MRHQTSRQLKGHPLKGRLIAAAAAVCFGAAGIAVPFVTNVATAPVAHASIVTPAASTQVCCDGDG